MSDAGNLQRNRYVDVDQAPESSSMAPRKQEAEAPDAPTSLFSLANLKVAQVNIVAGTLNGYSIGFVGVYATMYDMSTDCALYSAEKSCATLSNSNCAWDAATSTCGWADRVTCSQTYFTEESCSGNSKCGWSYANSVCRNSSGYSSSQNGIFAGAMIVGCMIGSFFAGPLAKRIGPKYSFLLVGLVSVVCSVLYHIATGVDQFWLLCVARLVIGLVLGLVCVAAPMYVDQNADPKYSKMIGVMFQVFTTFGIFFAAMIGLAVGQSVSYTKNSNQDLEGRMQALCTFSTFFSLLTILLGVMLGRGEKQAAAAAADGEEEEDKAAPVAVKEYTYGEMLPRLVMGGVVAGTLQLTGINAVMNYAPTIMSSLGLDPLVGNFVVMVWNFVTTIGSIPLASIFTMRQLFLAGSAITSAMCLFLCGIPVYPGVSSTTSAKNGVAITGILIFIAAFEMGVGPCFYVLAQDLFPPSFRPKGSSVTMVIQFIFNVIINVCYPIATEAMSGGPSGDPDKGQAIAFIFFGCIGIVCFVLQVFFLHPWSGDEEAAQELAPQDLAGDVPVEKSGDVSPNEVHIGVEAAPMPAPVATPAPAPAVAPAPAPVVAPTPAPAPAAAPAAAETMPAAESSAFTPREEADDTA